MFKSMYFIRVVNNWVQAEDPFQFKIHNVIHIADTSYGKQMGIEVYGSDPGDSAS